MKLSPKLCHKDSVRNRVIELKSLTVTAVIFLIIRGENQTLKPAKEKIIFLVGKNFCAVFKTLNNHILKGKRMSKI